jgi:hypothetical protein
MLSFIGYLPRSKYGLTMPGGASHISISPSEVKMKKLIILTAFVIVSALLAAAGTQPESAQSEGARAETTQPETSRPDNIQPGDASPEGPRPAYVGARKCKVCHLEIYRSWEKTRHAWALAALDDEQLQDPRCLACHTTGFGTGGYGGRSGVASLGGVQCEACHGPGSLYSRSSLMRKPDLCAEMGLVKPDSLACITCHNSESPTFKGFAYQAGLSTGTHSR